MIQAALEAARQRQMAAHQSEVAELQASKEAARAEGQALQAKCQGLESEKMRLEARVRSQVTMFAEWKGQFDGLYQVPGFCCDCNESLILRSRSRSLSGSVSVVQLCSSITAW